MKQFIEMIESHRKEAIYNYSYKYIKEINLEIFKNEMVAINRYLFFAYNN